MGYKDPIPKKHRRLRSVQQSRYLVSLLVAIVVTGILVFVSCFMAWFHLGGGAWRNEVAVVDAELRSPGGYVNRCVNDIRRRPSQPLSQRRSHPRIERRDRRLRSTQGPSDA